MAWEALPSAAIGAAIALSGTLFADVRRDRRQRDRDRDLDRRRVCVEFIVTMARVHGALRAIATPGTEAAARGPAVETPALREPTVEAPATKAPATKAPATKALDTQALGTKAPAAKAPDAREAALRSAVAEAMEPLYVAREQLLISAPAPLVAAGESAFHRLVEIRDAIRSGAALNSPAYHGPYHRFAEDLWAFRVAVRSDLGEPGLSPADLDRADWGERDTCSICAANP